MKTRSTYVLTVLAFLFTTNSFAGANNVIEIGSDVGVAGGTVDIDLTWTDGGTAGTDGLQFDVQYDNVNLSFVSCTLNPPYNGYDLSNCATFGDDVRIGLIDDFVSPGPIPSGVLGTITFMIDGGAAPGDYPLVFGPIVDTGNDPDATDLVPGNVEVQDVPMPALGSAPIAPGGTIDFGTHTVPGPDAMETLSISNTGNAEPLTGSCTISNDGGGVFSLAGDPVALNLDIADPALDLMLTCDTGTVGNFSGQLQCDHNGSNGPTSTWTLDCEVIPTPAYSSTPTPGGTIDLGDWPQNNPPTGDALQITNVGETGSVLMGTCSLMDGSVIQLSGISDYSDAEGGGSAMVGLTCDTTQPVGDYTDTLSCTENDPAFDGPASYTVECGILPPDPGMWGSTPPSGGTVELTPSGPVPVGTDLTDAAQLLVRNAGDPGDEDIEYTCSITGGSPEITQNPSPAMGTLAAGGPDGVINYSCNTALAGSFSATVQCDWTAPELEGVGDTELYTVTCDVRDPFSEVVEDPPSGTPQTAELMPGDGHTFNFIFEEVQNEGEDGEVSDCTLDTGTDFAITAPGTFPLTVPSGGMAQVDVTFTDPGMGDTFTDTLTCAIAHNPPPPAQPEGVDEFVSWPLEITVTGRNATFLVSKNFDDDNPAEVEVTLSCNTGLPLEQTTTISEGDPVNFVIVDFEPGTMDCDVFEAVPQGYAVVYDAELGAGGVASNVFEDEDGCHYEGIESADFICDITNELQPVDVVVNKEWIDDNPDFQLPTLVEVTLRCNADIIGGFPCGGDECADQFIDPSNPGVFQVFPDWDLSTSCSVTEAPEAGVLQDTSDCDSIPLAPGVDGECTIVNTRLFAGIPTLSQYGLILLALLMLGIGVVAFRRYS